MPKSEPKLGPGQPFGIQKGEEKGDFLECEKREKTSAGPVFAPHWALQKS